MPDAGASAFILTRELRTMDKPALYICYSINDMFAREAGISLTGFFENNPGYVPEEVFILDYGIHPANKQRLNQVAGNYGKRITYLNARPVTTAVKEEFPHLKGWRGSMAPNAKCFVEQIVPGYVERLLFIDADTVVAGSVMDLQSMDMGGAALGVVPGNTKEKRIAFNSGVLLFDLTTWRREGCPEMILETLRTKVSLPWPDQDLLNKAIPQHLLKPLPPKYNYYWHHHHPRQERKWMQIGDVFTADEIEEAIRQPVIIHYLGGWVMARPWYEGCRSSHAGEYYRYKAISPWKDSPLIKANTGVMRPRGIRQHIEFWRLRLYPLCPSFRLVQFTDRCSKAIINVLDKIKGNKRTQ